MMNIQNKKLGANMVRPISEVLSSLYSCIEELKMHLDFHISASHNLDITNALEIWRLAIAAGLRGDEKSAYELAAQYNAKGLVSQEAIDLVEHWFNWNKIEIFFNPEEIRSEHGESQKASSKT